MVDHCEGRDIYSRLSIDQLSVIYHFEQGEQSEFKRSTSKVHGIFQSWWRHR